MPKAMERLADVAESALNYFDDLEITGDEPLDIEPLLGKIDGLMDHLIRQQYLVMLESNCRWDTDELEDHMEDIVEEYYPADLRLEPDGSHTGGLFMDALKLLQIVRYRQVATMVVNRVSGDRLPRKLVKMIRDFICSDEELLLGVDPTSANNKNNE